MCTKQARYGHRTRWHGWTHDPAGHGPPIRCIRDCPVNLSLDCSTKVQHQTIAHCRVQEWTFSAQDATLIFDGARYPSGKGEVCKTFMRRFDSDPRLHSPTRINTVHSQRWPSSRALGHRFLMTLRTISEELPDSYSVSEENNG